MGHNMSYLEVARSLRLLAEHNEHNCLGELWLAETEQRGCPVGAADSLANAREVLALAQLGESKIEQAQWACSVSENSEEFSDQHAWDQESQACHTEGLEALRVADQRLGAGLL